MIKINILLFVYSFGESIKNNNGQIGVTRTKKTLPTAQ